MDSFVLAFRTLVLYNEFRARWLQAIVAHFDDKNRRSKLQTSTSEA